MPVARPPYLLAPGAMTVHQRIPHTSLAVLLDPSVERSQVNRLAHALAGKIYGEVYERRFFIKGFWTLGVRLWIRSSSLRPRFPFPDFRWLVPLALMLRGRGRTDPGSAPAAGVALRRVRSTPC